MESGSVADWFGAVGTIFAVVVSLVLAAKKNKKILKVQFTVGLKQYKKNNYTCSDGKVIYGASIFNYSQRPVHVYWCGMRISDKRRSVRRIALFLENRKSNLLYRCYMKLMRLQIPTIIQSFDMFGEVPKIEYLNAGGASTVTTVADVHVANIASSCERDEFAIEFCYRDTDDILYTAPIYWSKEKKVTTKNKSEVTFM